MRSSALERRTALESERDASRLEEEGARCTPNNVSSSIEWLRALVFALDSLPGRFVAVDVESVAPGLSLIHI